MSRNWRDIEYLLDGSKRQQEAYELLIEYDVLKKLKRFDPVLVSTICVGLDTKKSDLDIICCSPDLQELSGVLQSEFFGFDRFAIASGRVMQTLVCSFWIQSFEVEVFGSAQPVDEQPAYIHLSVMDRLLQIGGDQLRLELVKLKEQGLKTEPAIAIRLGLSGDPYTAVLELSKLSDQGLRSLLNQSLLL